MNHFSFFHHCFQQFIIFEKKKTMYCLRLRRQKPPNLDPSKHWLACYVMLSRAESLDGFLLARPATRNELCTRPPKYLLDELARLEKLEETSLPELLKYIDTLALPTPTTIRDLFHKDLAIARSVRFLHGSVTMLDQIAHSLSATYVFLDTFQSETLCFFRTLLLVTDEIALLLS